MTDGAGIAITGLGVAWEDLAPGQRLKTVQRTIREADLVMFTGMTGILPSTAVDATSRGARGEGAAAGVLPMLVYCLAEGLLTDWDRATGLGMDALDLTVERPCHIGDTIRLEMEIVSINGPLAGGRGRVIAYHVVRNQRNEAVIAYRQARLLCGRAERERLAGALSAGDPLAGGG